MGAYIHAQMFEFTISLYRVAAALYPGESDGVSVWKKC